jgi:hypothetical protein
MPITLNHSNIGVQYSSDKSYIIETVKSDLYLKNDNYDNIVRNNLQTAPVTPNIYIENGTNNVYAVESYTYSGSANTADFTRVFPKNTTGDILVIGGGGAGGTGHGGGGGGGSVIYTTGLSFEGEYNIKVGKGGIPAATRVNNGGNGNDSFVVKNGTNLYLAKGGGGGGFAAAYSVGSDGGSGGGGQGNATNGVGGLAVSTNIPTGVYGFAGGRGNTNSPSGGLFAGGGGGGSETIGSDAVVVNTSQINGGNGGNGKQIPITGNSLRYGGGGGGSVSNTGVNNIVGNGGLGGGGNGGLRVNGFTGTDGLGGGGGGGGQDANGDKIGGTGGSGIVIIRYLLGTIPANNVLTNEPVVVAPTFTETTRTFAHSGGAETQTTHTITVGRDTICDILIVGGGGGGGKFGGGGGSGAILFASNLLLNAGSYTIKVGKGGLGVNTDTQNGNNGQDSSITINGVEYIAKGGGGGGTRNGSYDGRNGNEGGSGGGGSHSNSTTVQGLGGISNKNTYSGWLSYGNNGGKGRLGVGTSAPDHTSGGGGGAGSAGGDFTNSTGGGNGGSGLNLSSTFGTSVGHSGWFGGGGGGQTYNGAGNQGYGNGGNGLLGGGGNGGFDGGTDISAQDGLPNTGGGGGGSKWDGGTAEDTNGGHGGSGIVIIKFKSTTPILEGITHKRLNFFYEQPSIIYDFTPYNNLASWTAYATSIGATYVLPYYDTATDAVWNPATAEGYISLPLNNNYNYLTVTFGNVLSNYNVFLRINGITKETCTGGQTKTYSQSYNTGDVLTILEDGTGINANLVITLSRTNVVTNTYTVNFQVPTLADLNNNTNIVLRGVYDLALSTSNAVIIPKADQYIPPPTTFTNYTIERMYPPVRNFSAATTTVSGQVYGNGTYVVTFSSTYGSSFDPFKCFNTSDTTGGAWALSRYTNGIYNGSDFIVSGYLGDWIKIQLPVAIKLTRFDFLMRPDTQGIRERSPKDFKIYGSNDNITWVELVNKTDAIYNASYKYEQTTPEITNTYTYYALVVNKLLGSTADTLNFNEWYIYGQEVLPSSLSIRYNLLNPILDPAGAQWTYNSSNTNVYHMGSVGIGTTSPEYSLDVRGFIFTSVGGYTQTGSENWVVQSDRRIKENIVKASYEKCLDNVKKIELYNFNFKDNCVNTNDKNQLGFIAQEVQQVYPKAVEVGRMTLDNNQGINDLLTLNTTQIKYTLYGAVKNLIERVENIESRVEQIYNMTLSSNIKSSSSNISITFITPLTPLTPNITTNTSNISTNTSNISTNTSNISTNSSNIDTSDMNLI